MKADLVDSLACPECRRPLGISELRSVFHLSGETHVADGRLSCPSLHHFPILDEIPRVVPAPQLTPEEQDALQRPAANETRTVTPEVVTPGEVEKTIRARVAQAYGLDRVRDPSARRRAESEADYLIAEYYGLNKHRYARLLKELLPAADSILDVGGSLPGLARSLAQVYGARRIVVADLTPAHGVAFKTPQREISLIRADVEDLPFAPGSFELVVSAFVLEHVPDWQRATRYLLQTGRWVFISFGPNRWFPYEIGHLDAPLAGTLPKPLAAYIAYLWLRIAGRGRPLSRIREILRGMTYISSRQFRSVCRGLGAEVTSVFPQFVSTSAADHHAPATLARRFVRARPGVATQLACLLSRVGLEPQVYTFLRPGHRSGADPTIPGTGPGG